MRKYSQQETVSGDLVKWRINDMHSGWSVVQISHQSVFKRGYDIRIVTRYNYEGVSAHLYSHHTYISCTVEDFASELIKRQDLSTKTT